MKIFTLTTKHDAMLETFKSFKDLMQRLTFINEAFYDGDRFGIYGGTVDEDEPYMIDSAVLTKRENGKLVYYTFLIHAIDSETALRTTLK